MDDADLANEASEDFTAISLRSARAKVSATRSTGICQSCQEAIGVGRLTAVPGATFCTECARDDEADRRRLDRLGA